MAKFKDLRYRDGFLTLGNKNFKVTKEELGTFIQGIAALGTWDGESAVEVCTFGDYKVRGAVAINKIQLLVQKDHNTVASATVSSNMDVFKDKKPVETGTLVFRIIQYLSQFL